MIDTVLHDVDALLLDWDGTVADTTTSNYMVLTRVLARRHMVMDRQWYDARVGLALADLLDRFAEHRGEPVPAAAILADCRAVRLSGTIPLTAVPAVADLLNAAHAAGVPCAVASGSSRQIVESGILGLGLEGAFRAVVTREDVELGKPAPDLFLAAAAAAGAAPQRCAAVDDAPEGVTAAFAAGVGKVFTLDRGRLHLVPRP